MHKPILFSQSALRIATALVASSLAVAPAFADDPPEQVDNGSFHRGPVNGPAADPGNADSVAVPGLQMGTVAYGGSGCPAGTVSSTLSPDQKTLTVLFDAYTIRAGGTAPPRARTGCSLQIPFQVPPGYRVQIVNMDYRGFASVPAGAGAFFNANFGYVGFMNFQWRRWRFNRGAQLNGPIQDNFILSTQISGPPWSPCGSAFTIQADSTLMAGTNAQGQEVLASIDSLDATSMPLRFHLRWQQCSGDDQPGPGPGPGGPGGPGRPPWGGPRPGWGPPPPPPMPPPSWGGPRPGWGPPRPGWPPRR